MCPEGYLVYSNRYWTKKSWIVDNKIILVWDKKLYHQGQNITVRNSLSLYSDPSVGNSSAVPIYRKATLNPYPNIYWTVKILSIGIDSVEQSDQAYIVYLIY